MCGCVGVGVWVWVMGSGFSCDMGGEIGRSGGGYFLIALVGALCGGWVSMRYILFY